MRSRRMYRFGLVLAAAWMGSVCGCGGSSQAPQVKPPAQEGSTAAPAGDSAALASADAPAPSKVAGAPVRVYVKHDRASASGAAGQTPSSPTPQAPSAPGYAVTQFAHSSSGAATTGPITSASAAPGNTLPGEATAAGNPASANGASGAAPAQRRSGAAARHAADEPPPAQNVVVSNHGETETVKVYYGTDRAVAEIVVTDGLTPGAWFGYTGVAAGVTIVLALLSHYFSSVRALLVASAVGLVVTASLGGITAYARWRPATADCMRRTYGRDRGALEVGYCDVSIPKRHAVGEIERPSVFHFELSEDPLKHVIVTDVQEQMPDDFFADLKAQIGKSKRKEAFIFVHGYNVTFEDAARRTAQIAYDMEFEGAPMFFSWPSQGGMLGYTVDENNVVWAVSHLKSFLVGVARRCGARSVHLIAHSMGNRALTSALKEMYFELDEQCPKFHHVVLTAPDVDADVFRRDLAPAVMKTARRVTLYASSNDEALVLSKKVHGYARAGESGDQLVVLPGMDTIDVSNVDTSMLGHSYYGDSRSVLADLFELLNQSRPPQQRKWLLPITVGQLIYWVFSEAAVANKPANVQPATR